MAGQPSASSAEVRPSGPAAYFLPAKHALQLFGGTTAACTPAAPISSCDPTRTAIAASGSIGPEPGAISSSDASARSPSGDGRGRTRVLPARCERPPRPHRHATPPSVLHGRAQSRFSSSDASACRPSRGARCAPHRPGPAPFAFRALRNRRRRPGERCAAVAKRLSRIGYARPLTPCAQDAFGASGDAQTTGKK